MNKTPPPTPTPIPTFAPVESPELVETTGLPEAPAAL